MKVTFKRRNLAISCQCELMHKKESNTLTSFSFKTTEMSVIDLWLDEIKESDRVLIFEDADGLEFKSITNSIEQYENYAIIRINCY